MKVLAVDSSGLVASVALAEDDILIAEYNIQYKITHSQTLLPMLDEIKKMIDLDLSSIDAIAVAAGPGSFTGLRIGAATVKGLGLALDKPIVPVPTVAGLAYNFYGSDKVICPIMDARRSQVYTGLYTFEPAKCGYKMITIRPQCAVPFADVAKWLNELGKEVIFLGDGVPVFAGQMEELLAVDHRLAPAHMNRQRAASVAVLGMELYRQGVVETADEHTPEYLRLSQAERERKEKEQDGRA